MFFFLVYTVFSLLIVRVGLRVDCLGWCLICGVCLHVGGLVREVGVYGFGFSCGLSFVQTGGVLVIYLLLLLSECCRLICSSLFVCVWVL